MQLRDSLSEGDVLSVYTDYQDEDESTYEGKAVLMRRLKNGDSFYLRDEEIKVGDKKTYTIEEQIKMTKYNALKTAFYGNGTRPNKFVRKFHRLLIEQRRDESDDFARIEEVIMLYKPKPFYRKFIHDLLKKFTIYYICQFIQQDREKWRPTIWNYERWLVQFQEDNWGYPASHTTQRNFRYVSCIMPSENIRDADIRRYTTYNGESSVKMSKCEDCDDDLETNEEEDELI